LSYIIRKREKKHRKWGWWGSDTLYLRGARKWYSLDLNVLRQCPLALLVEVCLKEDEAVRGEKVKR
jgi:hypothetical protein